MSGVSDTPVVRKASSPQRGTAGTPKATAFAVIGDRYHNSAYIRVALGKTLVRDAGVSIDFTDEVSLLSADTLHGYRLLIVFRDGMVWPQGYGDSGSYPGYGSTSSSPLLSVPPLPAVDAKPRWWMTPAQGKAVKQFVAAGGSALFYHNSSNISLSNEDFRDVEGAIYTGHPPVRPFTVRIVNPTHPITRGVRDFIVTDEQHYVQYEKEARHVFLESENLEGRSYVGSLGDQGPACEAGWAYDYGRGRVCFLAPGHMISVLWNPEYVKLQANAVQWLLRER
jgi:hypothetical protein